VTDRGELARGLTVRLQLLRERASAELDLGDSARFYPTDAAIDRWRAGAHNGRAAGVYD
jgi:DNA polymerase-3 subunit alpha